MNWPKRRLSERLSLKIILLFDALCMQDNSMRCAEYSRLSIQHQFNFHFLSVTYITNSIFNIKRSFDKMTRTMN